MFMIFIQRPHTDPWFNLAAEEFLLKNRTEDLVMVWQNAPSVVVGKHQNVMAEVDIDFVRKQQIPVIRRLSGGGTVFHDTGNMNLTVISTKKKGDNLIDFRKFSEPVLEFLQQHFGLKAVFEGKNNLTLNGKKFSGNAAHVFKNRVLHHGTLLYQTDLDRLEKIIRMDNTHLTDRSVKSIRATVGNISEHLKNPPPLSLFLQQFISFLKDYYSIVDETILTKTEQQAIARLAEEKYKSWKWNFGYSPPYTIQKQHKTEYGTFEVSLQVTEGRIASVDLLFEGKKLEKTEQKLLGQKHDKEALSRILTGNRFSETIINTLF